MMELLEKRILADGRVLSGDVLKVDGFINHQIDVPFVSRLGEEFHRLFADCGVTKILTVEASGIGIACLTAVHFGVPVVFAKKSVTSNLSGSVYSAKAHSYTHGSENTLVVSSDRLCPSDKLLLIDDFLANGCALNALAEIAGQAGAEIVGAGVVIEKAYQGGGDKLRAQGIRVEALARIASLDPEDGIVFAHCAE